MFAKAKSIHEMNKSPKDNDDHKMEWRRFVCFLFYHYSVLTPMKRISMFNSHQFSDLKHATILWAT